MANGFQVKINIILATFLPHFAVSLALGSVGPLALYLQKAFDINRAQIGMLTSVHSIGWIIMAFVSGGVVERTRASTWIFLCPALSGICALIFISTSSYIQGLFIFLLLGFAFSFINPATSKAIIAGFPQVGRGTAFAIKQTGVPAGVLLASVSLPSIAYWAGWKWGMGFVAVVNVLSGICGWLILRDNVILKESDKNNNNLQGNFKKDFGILFHNMDFMLVSILQGAINICQYVMQSYLILYLVESLGYSSIYSGLILAVTQFTGVFGRILCGLVSDYIFGGRRVPTLQVTGLLTVIGLFGLALMERSLPNWIIWVSAPLAGVGSIGFAGTSILFRAEVAGKNLVATSTGVGMAIAAWGVLLGPPIFGYIVDTTHSYKIAWLLLAFISLAATILLWLVSENKKAAEEVIRSMT